MKFALASDLHNEFYSSGEAPALPEVDADVLVLAGDIQTPDVHDKGWWDKTCAPYRWVIYIRGNHEYYGTYYAKYPELEFPKNVISVGRMPRPIRIDGISILCGTMWTDLSNPMHALTARNVMNDYRRIEYSPGRYWFTPEDTTREWQSFKVALEEEKPDVVVSHHLPSYGSVDPVYKNDTLNSAYATEMDTGDVALWLHGHTHHPQDYVKQGCRIVCNPAGYPGQRESSYTPKVIEF
jgi:predicted phosphodiesterase